MRTGDLSHDDAVRRVGAVCARLEGAREHDAWTGAAWRVGRTTFAHVVEVVDGRPPAYARVFRTDGPASVVTFQCRPEERDALARAGPPFHLPGWRPGIVGVVLDHDTDWTHVAELIADSHALCSGPARSRHRSASPGAGTTADDR